MAVTVVVAVTGVVAAMAATPVISAAAVATATMASATATAPVSATTACSLGIDGDCRNAHGGDGRYDQRFDRSHIDAPWSRSSPAFSIRPRRGARAIGVRQPGNA
jgi:hypothetical protein